MPIPLSARWKTTFVAPALACLLLLSPSFAQETPPWAVQAEAHQKTLDATPVKDNGYPLLAPHLKAEKAGSDLEALEGYFSPWPKMVKLDGVAFARDRARFAPSLPLLKKAFTRPIFHYNSKWGLGTEGTIPYLVILKKAALSYLVEAKARGDVGMALETLALAKHVSDQRSIIAMAIAISINSAGLDTLYPLLSRKSLTADQLRAARSRFEEAALPAQALALAWDDEVSRVGVSLGRAEEGVGDPLMAAEFQSQPDLKRTKSLYFDLWSRYRPFVLESAPTEKWTGQFEADLATLEQSGAAGALVRQTASGIAGSSRSWEKVLARQEALRLLIALRLYQIEKGSLPQTVSELPDHRAAWNALGYQRTSADAFELDAPIWATDQPVTRRPFPIN